MAGLFVLVLALYLFRHSYDRRKGKLSLEISVKKRRQDFIKQAQRLGFTHVEARMLRQIAGHGEAEYFDRLLKKGSHFLRLAAQVVKQAGSAGANSECLTKSSLKSPG